MLAGLMMETTGTGRAQVGQEAPVPDRWGGLLVEGRVGLMLGLGLLMTTVMMMWTSPTMLYQQTSPTSRCTSRSQPPPRRQHLRGLPGLEAWPSSLPAVAGEMTL